MPAHDVETWESRFHWGILRTLGNSRLVTSSVVWLFVVPIAAKLLAPFAGPYTLNLPWGNEPIAVMVALPFSWPRFYLMSWLFVIGQAVYWLACPEIVRKYASFLAYRADHPSDGKLREFIRIATQQRSERVLERLTEPRESWGLPPVHPPFNTPDNRTLLSSGFKKKLAGSLPLADKAQSRVFDALLAAEHYAHRFGFWVSGVFFAGGLGLFAWVVAEGAIEVWKLL